MNEKLSRLNHTPNPLKIHANNTPVIELHIETECSIFHGLPEKYSI